MACVEDLAAFAARASYGDLSMGAREQLRIRILDALGCAIAALESEPVRIVREQAAEAGGGSCTLIGGGRAALDRAAFCNGALVRHLGFNDGYLARGESCHPSDNVAAVLAAGEYAGGTGRDALTALAVAYQVQCRLSDVAPARAAGFDHTTQGAFAAAAGVARMLGLDRARAAHAIAMAGAGLHALGVTRTGRISQWEWLAYPSMAAGCTRAACLAMRGITGPLEVFEGEKGLMDAITGVFDLRWGGEDLERVRRTLVKKHDGETHAQTAIEAVLELKRTHAFEAAEVESVAIEIFEAAYNTIGGGEDGDRTAGVDTREQADHSLPYMVAAALLDGRLMPEQYREERIRSGDVQKLLRAVSVRPNAAFTRAFPESMPCRARVMLRGGRALEHEAREYPGFPTQPLTWEMAVRKFETLAAGGATPELRRAMADAVANIENIQVAELMQLLAGVRPQAAEVS